MKKTTTFQTSIRTVAYVSALIFLVHSTYAYADFNTDSIVAETNSIRSFLFGPGSKIVAIFGAAWGVFQSIVTGSPKPLLIFGAIALAAGFLPKFIDMVF